MFMKKMGRLQLTLYALAALILIVLGLGIGQRLTAQADNQPDVLSDTFQAVQQAEDRLPDAITSDFSEVQPSSTRLLAQYNNRTHWAAYNQEGEVCVISMIGTFPQDYVAALGCNTVEHFRKHGVFVRVYKDLHTDKSEVSTAVLFPDGYQDTIRAQIPDAEVFENIVVFNNAMAVDLPDATLTVAPDANESDEALELLIPEPSVDIKETS